MSGDTLDFLQGNRETLTGTLHDPAATTGHVLTVQADKSIAAAPGGGSAPGALALQGPFTVPFTDVALDANNLAVAVFTTLAPGTLVFGTAWNTTVPFDDTGGGNAQITPYSVVAGTQTRLASGDMQLASSNTVDGLGTGGVYAKADIAAPGAYTTASGLNPKQATLLPSGSFYSTLPWIVGASAADVALFFPSWNADGAAGSVDLYLLAVT